MGSNNTVAWIPSPNRRGTIDVLWICAFTLFICTWTVLHPNIPTRGELLARWTQWRFWRKRLKLAGLMVVMVVAPELVVALAARDWLWARSSVREMRELGFQDRQWSMSHAFFANMGGYVVNVKVQHQEEMVARGKGEAQSLEQNLESLQPSSAQREELEIHSLCAAQVALLIRQPYELHLPELTKEDLQDRSKSSTFAKLMACMQAGWLVVECIARAEQHLAVSQLELATAGFVGCTVVTYLFWWNKPKDVESTVAISCPSELQAQISHVLAGLAISDYRRSLRDLMQKRGRMPFLPVMNPEGRTTTRMSDIIPLVFAAVGAAFSTVHIIAWDFQFPTHAEMVIWRTSSVAAAGFCLLIYVTVRLRIRYDCNLIRGRNMMRGQVWTDISTVMILSMIMLYTLARSTLIVQIFLCFRRTPNSVYDTVNWTRYFGVFA